jgi:hypothetical protein
VRLGLYLVRGENIVLMGDLDPTRMDNMEQVIHAIDPCMHTRMYAYIYTHTHTHTQTLTHKHTHTHTHTHTHAHTHILNFHASIRAGEQGGAGSFAGKDLLSHTPYALFTSLMPEIDTQHHINLLP